MIQDIYHNLAAVDKIDYDQFNSIASLAHASSNFVLVFVYILGNG